MFKETDIMVADTVLLEKRKRGPNTHLLANKCVPVLSHSRKKAALTL